MGALACKNCSNPIKCNRIPTITLWHIQITRQCCIFSVRNFWVFPAALRMLLGDPRSYNLDTTTSGLICTMVTLTWATLLRGESLELILQWKSVCSLREKPRWYYCRTHPLLNCLLQLQLRKTRHFITVAVRNSLPTLCFARLSACCFSAALRTNRMAVSHLILQSSRW